MFPETPAAGTDAAARCYALPPGRDIRALAEALARFFRESRDARTELIMIPRGWVVQILGPDGRLGRWHNREGEYRHVRMIREGNLISVRLMEGEWSPGADAPSADAKAWADPEMEAAAFTWLSENLRC